MRAVVLAKGDEIVKVYENMGVMAKHEDISLATAYYRVRPTTEPIHGIRFWFEDKFLEQFPDSGAALKKAKKDMIVSTEEQLRKSKRAVAKPKEETMADNELELDATPVTESKKEKRKMKKGTPTESPKTKPVADKSEAWELKETVETHPEYSEKIDELIKNAEKDEDCWRRMSDILGPERMSVYAHCEALRHLLRAKDTPGEYAENMRRAAYYSTMAASMANKLEEKMNG